LSANVLADVAAGAAAVARWYDRSNARTDRSNSAPASLPSLPLPVLLPVLPLLLVLVFVCLSAAAAASLLTVSRAKSVTSPTAHTHTHTHTRRMVIGRMHETGVRGEIRGWIGG